MGTLRQAVELARAAVRRGRAIGVTPGTWPWGDYPTEAHLAQAVIRDTLGRCPRVLTLDLLEWLVAGGDKPVRPISEDPRRRARARAALEARRRAEEAAALAALRRRYAREIEALRAGLRTAGLAHDGAAPDGIYLRLEGGLDATVVEESSWEKYSKSWHRSHGPARWTELHWRVGPEVLRQIRRGWTWRRIDAQTVALAPAGEGAHRCWTVRRGRGAERTAAQQWVAWCGESAAIGTTAPDARARVAALDLCRSRREAKAARLEVSRAQESAAGASEQLVRARVLL